MAISFQKRYLRGDSVLNQKEMLILASLRKDARKSMTDISKETDIPVSTVFDKIAKLESNLIKNHSSLIDFNKIGYHGRAIIAAKLDTPNDESMIGFLLNHPNINCIYRLHNNCDVLFECIFKNILSVDEFVRNLERSFPIKYKHVFYVTQELMEEHFLSSPEHFGK